MNEIIGKYKRNSNRFLKLINVNGKALKRISYIAEEFNKYFTNLRPNLASQTQNIFKTFRKGI